MQEVDWMKLERISENKIRCTLTGNDLSSRQIMLGELAYGSDKARQLFRDMMDLAAEELGFETEDMPIVVEAVPMANGSIVLTISKVENPEELDARFSRFTPPPEDSEEEAEEGGSVWQAVHEYDIDEPESSAGIFSPDQEAAVIFEFASLSDVSQMSRHLPAGLSCFNTLYKKPLSGRYYLAADRSVSSQQDFMALCRLCTEYGSRCRAENVQRFLSHIREHDTLILRGQAVQRLRDL